MSNRFRAFLAAIVSVLIFSLFQNCAPTAVEYAEVPAPQEPSVAPTEVPVGPSGILGQVTHALTNEPLQNTLVEVRRSSQPQSVIARIQTDASGRFQTEDLPPGAYLVDFTLTGFIPVKGVSVNLVAGTDSSINQSLSAAIQDNQIRVVLNWTGPKVGAVEDVDAYMIHPASRLPIYFNGRTGEGIQLDIDIRTWRGPETITITDLKAGSYVYYVNNYSNRTDRRALGNSEVKVTVYRGSKVHKIYSVPAGSGETYEVFRIDSGVILDVLRYNDGLTVVQ